MKSGADGQKEAIEKAAKLLSGAKTLYMATNGSHGHPNLRAMMPVKVDGVKSVWFLTDAASSKIVELAHDGHAVLYAEAPRMAGECRFWGTVAIFDDFSVKQELWKEDYRPHFPNGPESENMRVLRFDVSNGVYVSYKDMESVPFKND